MTIRSGTPSAPVNQRIRIARHKLPRACVGIVAKRVILAKKNGFANNIALVWRPVGEGAKVAEDGHVPAEFSTAIVRVSWIELEGVARNGHILGLPAAIRVVRLAIDGA